MCMSRRTHAWTEATDVPKAEWFSLGSRVQLIFKFSRSIKLDTTKNNP